MSTEPEELPETPDTYEGAAEVDPDNWRRDPLLDLRKEEDLDPDDENFADGAEGDLDPDEDELGVDLDHPVAPSEQDLRDETAEQRYLQGEEQIPPEEPTMGEALADLDVPGDPAFPDEIDPSNDSFHGGADR